MQQKTHRPVHLITEQTRDSLANWISQTQLKSDEYLFISRIQASLDKAPVRNEVSRLKVDFERLCAEGKITCERQAIMTSTGSDERKSLSSEIEKLFAAFSQVNSAHTCLHAVIQ